MIKQLTFIFLLSISYVTLSQDDSCKPCSETEIKEYGAKLYSFITLQDACNKIKELLATGQGDSPENFTQIRKLLCGNNPQEKALVSAFSQPERRPGSVGDQQKYVYPYAYEVWKAAIEHNSYNTLRLLNVMIGADTISKRQSWRGATSLWGWSSDTPENYFSILARSANEHKNPVGMVDTLVSLKPADTPFNMSEDIPKECDKFFKDEKLTTVCTHLRDLMEKHNEALKNRRQAQMQAQILEQNRLTDERMARLSAVLAGKK